ncbi:MAG: helix-turn-helix domain-containing protein [Muribaculaceae bacterium]|nr:helix-turn-helix domain-containing protein [Muribaculaceae bacterium]
MNANNDNYDENGLPKGNKPNYVVVPIEIWEAENLSWSERVLLVEIDRHTRNGRDCFMSNAYIAHFLNTSEKNASKLLNSLIKKGYVVMTRFDGRKRFISSTLETVVGSIPQSDGFSIHQKVESDSTKKATILVNEYNSNEFNSIESKKNSACAHTREGVVADIIENNTSWVENQIKTGIDPDDIPALLSYAYDHLVNTGDEPNSKAVVRCAFFKLRDFKEHRRRERLRSMPYNERKKALWQQLRELMPKYGEELVTRFYAYQIKIKDGLMNSEQSPDFDPDTELTQWKLNDEKRQRPAL